MLLPEEITAEQIGRFSLSVEKRHYHFKRPLHTSRGRMEQHCIYEIRCASEREIGLGECAPLRGLSPEWGEALEELIEQECRAIQKAQVFKFSRNSKLPSSLRFGLECAFLNAYKRPFFPSPYSRGEKGIPIHHLIWMDSIESMLAQTKRGIEQGFSCYKLKVGALEWSQELDLLREIRRQFPEIEIRLDANGAWSPNEARRKLEELASLSIAWLEQPIAARQRKQLAQVIAESPIPIALDEELIGIETRGARERLLEEIRPQALVLKPSLHGGLHGAEQWLELATERGIEVWLNSALESPLSLDMLTLWAGCHLPEKLHGLSTGKIYLDAPEGRSQLRANQLFYRNSISNK